MKKSIKHGEYYTPIQMKIPVVMDVQQFTDMDCFIPLMDKFSKTYGFYPQYPVADAEYRQLQQLYFFVSKIE